MKQVRTLLVNKAGILSPANHGMLTQPIIPRFALLLAGAGVFMAAGCQSALPRHTMALHESVYPDVDRTCAALKPAIEAQGLQCLGIRNMNQSMAKYGVHLERQVRVVEFCRADYAHDMLKETPEVCTLMPCTFGVFQGHAGRVYISTMNQQMMSTLSGSAIARVMGERVANDEAAILKTVARSTEVMQSDRVPADLPWKAADADSPRDRE